MGQDDPYQWCKTDDQGLELVELDQRGNQEYINEIGNNYKKIHIFEHWPETLATNTVQIPVQTFYLFPYE
jgi:hypothetical protein